MNKIKEYLSYPSTWKGLIAGLTLVGINILPAQADAISNAGVAVIAAIWTFFSDTDV